MEYKKIFDITLNNKKFAIFIDDRKRYTFLEIDKDGNYVYPELNDFLMLHNVYNNRNPFIVSMVQKYTYKEKVKFLSGVLAVLVVVNGAVIVHKFSNYDAEVKDNELVLEEVVASPSYVEIKKFEDLDAIIGKVTIEDVHNVIDANNKLPFEYKVFYHQLANEIHYKYPKADLRVLYLNAKDLDVNQIQEEEIQKKYKQSGIAANFCAREHKINAAPDCVKEFKVHELGHTVTTLWLEVDGITYYKTCSQGHALDEAMNNKVTSLIEETTTYKKEGAVLDYLCTCVPFTIEDYINNNIDYLINLLKEKYPDVDVDFIISTLDAMKTTSTDFGVEIALDANISFLDELFLMCQKNVNLEDNVYKPFTNFAKLLDFANDGDLFYTYLDRYNEYLESLGVTNTENSLNVCAIYGELQSVKGFAYDEEGVYPIYVVEKNVNGNIEAVEQIIKNHEVADGFHGQASTSESLITYLLYSLPENRDILLENEYWQKVAIESGVLNLSNIKPSNLYWKGKLLGTEYIKNIYLQVGANDKGEIGFILYNNKWDVLYKSLDNMINLSEIIPLRNYLGKTKDKQSVELSTYLNDSYLKWFVINYDYLFINVFVENDKLVVEPMQVINVERDSLGMKASLFEAKLEMAASGNLILYPFNIPINVNIEMEKYPTLREILKAYNILNPDIKEYTIKEEDLVKYVEDYLKVIEVNKAR